MTPVIRIPEKKKKPGVYYAVTHDGLEVPIIDVTHPAFHLEPTAAQIDALTDQYVRTTRYTYRLPSFLRYLFFAYLRRRSMLVDGLMRARVGHLDGITTYLMKLGPENLGEGYATAVDRKFASGLPPFLARWRVQQIADFLADGMEKGLVDRPEAPLLLVNIAGGTAIDSLNALIVLRKRSPNLFYARRIGLCVLDLDEKGPAFCSRAIQALQADGAPLKGLDIQFEIVRYDWTDTTTLSKVLEGHRSQESVLAVSSEGGLFEYGDDEVVTRNLHVIRDYASADTVIAGSVMLDTEFFHQTLKTLHLATILRTHEGFRALVGQSRWKVHTLIETPASFNVRLEPF